MKSMIINGRTVEFENEKNILEVARKANVEIPTFCYHSELSVYGACRLCLVEVEGRGIVASCSTTPEDGMIVRTNTAEIREMRKITIELLLANEGHDCTSCAKNTNCKLQDIAAKMGVYKVRYKKMPNPHKIDTSSPSIVRDPSKCILCGDCVRACYEIQGIGAIDFVGRGSHTSVQPAFLKGIDQVDCVNCGQCVDVCPTGALMPKNDIEEVWKILDNPKKKVVAQIAPAVRVAVGEAFGVEPGKILTGQIIAALKHLGFDKVYDTCFGADLTVIEEATEFIGRFNKGERLPQFTSCCPGWVKYAEQYYPELLGNLSTCKSPQQMFGSVAKEILPEQLKIAKEDLTVVSIMPCTAKKFEHKRPEFEHDGIKEVDFVITTQELIKMIKEAGIRFMDLAPESLDMPLGFKTGAGIIFGASGGVSEAVLRYAHEKIKGEKLDNVDFTDVRGMAGLREATVTIGNIQIKIAIVHSLKNAKALIEELKAGRKEYDLVEVMACPHGCVGGAGQPVCYDPEVKKRRTEGIYAADKMAQLHKSQENPYIEALYKETLGEIGGEKAHQLLHTEYKKRRRIQSKDMELMSGENKIIVKVCLGTACFVRGSHSILKKMTEYVEQNNLESIVNVKASFCMENCDRGPTVTVNGNIIHKCTINSAIAALEGELDKIKEKA